MAAGFMFLVFAGLAVLPFAGLTTLPRWIVADQRAITHSPVPLATAPTSAPTIAFDTGPRATQPTVDPTRSAALVKSEDQRIRKALHGIQRVVLPTVRQIGSGAPTLILPARPLPYTANDLFANQALVTLPNGGGVMLVDDIVAGPGATLNLGGASMTVLRMETTPTEFTSIVVAGGTLNLDGASSDVPLTITSWNPATSAPATDSGTGRSYLRADAATMTLRYVNAGELGFWSGRTGGVAWTGSSTQPSTGGAYASTFTGSAYGAFVSSATQMTFLQDVFDFNEADGIRLHRNTVGTTIQSSSSVRNGGNGFVVDRGATSNTLSDDEAVNNAVNGFLIDGRPLVQGLSPSGAGTSPSVGTLLQHSDAENNGHVGIMLEGGRATRLSRNLVCSSTIGIALRDQAVGTILTGNYVKCGGTIDLELTPGVTGTTLLSNTFANARMGILVHGAPGVRLINNHLVDNSIFAISIRGASPDVEGTSNVITGLGVRSLDVQQGAPQPVIVDTDISGWSHRAKVNPVNYVFFHPILLVWGCVIALVALSSLFARLRRQPHRVYSHAPVPNHAVPVGVDHQPVQALQQASPVLVGTGAPKTPAPAAAAAQPRSHSYHHPTLPGYASHAHANHANANHAPATVSNPSRARWERRRRLDHS